MTLRCRWASQRRLRDIDKIIEKSIKELCRELDLIDRATKRQAFKNLKYAKNYDNFRRGKPITSIKFTFTKLSPNREGYAAVKKAIAAKNR